MSYDQDEIELTPEQLAQLQHSDTDIICDAAGIPRIAWTAVGAYLIPDGGPAAVFTFTETCHGLAGPALGNLDDDHGLAVAVEPQREVSVGFGIDIETDEVYVAWVNDERWCLVTRLQSRDGVPVTRLRREQFEWLCERTELERGTEAWEVAIRLRDMVGMRCAV